MKKSLVPLSLILSSLACAEIPQIQMVEQEQQAAVQKCYLQFESNQEEIASDESYQSDEVVGLDDSAQSDNVAVPSKRAPAARVQKQPQRAAVQKNPRAQNERSYAHPRPLNQVQKRSIADDQEPMPMTSKQTMAGSNNRQQDAAMFNDKNYPGFYIGADFIYWKAEVEGLDYAIDGLLINGPRNFNSEPSKGKLHTPQFEWEPGFKVQIGYCSEDWAWDTFLNWTWLHADANGKANGPNAFNNQTLYSLWNPVYYYFGQAKSIKANWDLHYNTLEWMLGRTFSIGKHFSAKPMAGVRGASIDQDYNLNYDGAVYPGAKMQVRNDGDFIGAGVIGGISTSWYFNNHFSFFSDTAFSLVYGHTKASVKVLRTEPPTIDQTVVHFKNELNSVKSEIEAGLGFRYETGFSRGKCHLAFDVKWEYLNWFDMNPFLLPLTGTSVTDFPVVITPVEYSGSYGHIRGGLGMMGLTVGAKFTF